jgi:hypothetical protein
MRFSISNSNSSFLTLGTTPHARGTMCNQGDAMFLHSIRSEQLTILAEQVRLADEATPTILAGIVTETGRRLSAPARLPMLPSFIN